MATQNESLIQGTTVTDPESVRAAYQLGDFRYQFVRKSGKVSRIMTCSNPRELEQLAKQVKSGNPIVISLGR